MQDTEIELHDALLKSMRVDYVGKTAEIDIEYYQSTDDSKRIEGTLQFQGVESVTQTTDLNRLAKNAFAGNINYWVPAYDTGTTYIYLMDGCISIKAKALSFKRPAC